MRAFSVKTELVDSSSKHFRYLPGPMAAMVEAGWQHHPRCTSE